MRLRVSRNTLDSCFNCALREAAACWFDESGIVGYAQAALVGPQRPRQVVDGSDLIYAMDSIDQSSYDFAVMLVETHAYESPLAHARQGARWLADFRLLELHPSRRGKGLGVRLGAQFLDALRSSASIGFFALKPFPLQYSYGDGPREQVDFKDDPAGFARDVSALRRIYAEAWGAAPLPGSDSYLFVPGSAPYRLRASADASQWWLS